MQTYLSVRCSRAPGTPDPPTGSPLAQTCSPVGRRRLETGRWCGEDWTGGDGTATYPAAEGRKTPCSHPEHPDKSAVRRSLNVTGISWGSDNSWWCSHRTGKLESSQGICRSRRVKRSVVLKRTFRSVRWLLLIHHTGLSLSSSVSLPPPPPLPSVLPVTLHSLILLYLKSVTLAFPAPPLSSASFKGFWWTLRQIWYFEFELSCMICTFVDCQI